MRLTYPERIQRSQKRLRLCACFQSFCLYFIYYVPASPPLRSVTALSCPLSHMFLGILIYLLHILPPLIDDPPPGSAFSTLLFAELVFYLLCIALSCTSNSPFRSGFSALLFTNLGCCSLCMALSSISNSPPRHAVSIMCYSEPLIHLSCIAPSFDSHS